MNQLQNLSKQQYIGSVDFVLGSLCSSMNQELTAQLKYENPLKKKGNLGSLKICAEEKKPDSGSQMASFIVQM